MRIKGVRDDRAVLITCPKCQKKLMVVHEKAAGVIYPYCKLCGVNVSIELPVRSKRLEVRG